MGRAPCSSNSEKELRKGAWTADEDEKLLSFIHSNNGHGSWRTLPHLAGLQRCGKSCRLRWTNYLRPNIKRGNFTPEEETAIIQLHQLLGNKWAGIASRLPGRTDNEVKNHWNTRLKKRLSRMGIDPATHRPTSLPAHLDLNSVNIRDNNMMKHIHNSSVNSNQKNTVRKVSLVDQSFVSHMAQWELARLEAEARLMSAKSSDKVKYPSSTECRKQEATYSRGQGKENELLEVFRELMEAPTIAHEKSTPLPSLDTSNTCSSACSQFMNEAEITSGLTYIHNHMSPSPSFQYHHDPLLAQLTPASDPLPPCEASSHAYWANMLSLVGTVMSSCPC